MVAVLVFCLVDKIKIATSIGMLYLAYYPFLIGINYNTLDPATFTPASALPILPFSIVGLLLLMAIFSLFSFGSAPKNDEPKATRLVFLFFGLVFVFIAISSALLAWYVPETIGLDNPTPKIGVWGYNLFILVGALLMYLASRKNSDNRPNLIRKILAISIVLGLNQFTYVLSLILLYSFPSTSEISYPLESSYIFVASLIWGLLLLLMNKEAVITKR